MPLQLSDFDYEYLRALKDHGYLEMLIPEEVDLTAGAVKIACPDCDQREDMNSILEIMCLHHRPSPRLHPLKLNGGGFLLAPNSPLVKNSGRDVILIEDTVDAMDMKEMTTVLNIAHLPCGKINSVGLTAPQAMELFIRGRDQMIEALARPEVRARLAKKLGKAEKDLVLQVACLLHVDYGFRRPTKQKRMYHVPTSLWQQHSMPEPFSLGMHV